MDIFSDIADITRL